MRVSREKWLAELEAVQPGLSSREIVEQSSCFVFTGKQVVTYNDEVACSYASCLKIRGAVQANSLLAILKKLPEEEIEVSIKDGELLICGKRREMGLKLEAEVTLPIDVVETPDEWKSLPAEFAEAISVVQQCAGKDESKFSLTCVHIAPKWVEATDNYQIARFRLETGFATATLVRRDSIKHITSLGMHEFAETENWLHFRNPNGLVLSCRRYLEDFPKVGQYLRVSGTPLTLPKGLTETVERAEIFSNENVDKDMVEVSLEPGKLRIRGVGLSGWYRETKKLPNYEGDQLQFMIPPKLLAEIVRAHDVCEVTKEYIKVDGGKFVYVSCLSVAEAV